MHQRGFVYRLHIYPKFIDSINSVIIPVHTKQLSSNDMLHPHHRYKHLKDIIYIYVGPICTKWLHPEKWAFLSSCINFEFPTSPPISNLIYFSLDLKSKSATISLHFRHAILNRNFITNMSQKLGTFISLKYFKALLKNWHEWEEYLPISSHGSHLILAWTGIKGFYLTLRSATGATKIKVHGVIIFNSRDHRGHKFQE